MNNENFYLNCKSKTSNSQAKNHVTIKKGGRNYSKTFKIRTEIIMVFITISLLSAGIEYPSVFGETIENDIGSISIDSTTFEISSGSDELLNISGVINSYQLGSRGNIIITLPDGLTEGFLFVPTDGGYFELLYSIKGNSQLGNYEILGSYKNQIIGILNFSISEKNFSVEEIAEARNQKYVPEVAVVEDIPEVAVVENYIGLESDLSDVGSMTTENIPMESSQDMGGNNVDLLVIIGFGSVTILLLIVLVKRKMKNKEPTDDTSNEEEREKYSQDSNENNYQEQSNFTLKQYYDILEVDENATSDQIKTSRRRLILLWHPDKHRSLSRKKIAEIETKKINNAYEKLQEAGKLL